MDTHHIIPTLDPPLLPPNVQGAKKNALGADHAADDDAVAVLDQALRGGREGGREGGKGECLGPSISKAQEREGGKEGQTYLHRARRLRDGRQGQDGHGGTVLGDKTRSGPGLGEHDDHFGVDVEGGFDGGGGDGLGSGHVAHHGHDGVAHGVGPEGGREEGREGGREGGEIAREE